MIFKRVMAVLCTGFLIGPFATSAWLAADPLPEGALAAPVQPAASTTPPANGVQNAPAAGAATAAPATPNAFQKDPLIEVSVDTLEISEKDAEDLGLSWNNIISFQERSIPSIFNVGSFARLTQLEADLHLLLTHNQARILANPTLLTKSSFEATFSVGGEIPYPTVGQGGVQGVEYKKYGVILKILPVITPRKTIDAQINVTVSNPDSANAITLNGIQVPAIASRDAGSKVEVLDGETVVLAGIKQSNRSKTVTKVPFLGSIPLLGLLFRETNDTVTQNSLVIFVTFRLIK